jgi:acyl-CoA thioester hydrolase
MRRKRRRHDATMPKVAPHRTDVASYPYRVRILARFADVDPLWHINNVAIAQYYEEARVSANMTMLELGRIPTASTGRILVAHQSIDYLQEANYPGALDVGVGVLRVGNSSYTFGMAMFQDDRCVSVSDAVLVYADAHGPARLPDPFRLRLEDRRLREPAPQE